MPVTFHPMYLSERRVLITGASSGIGRACAVLASKLGATCVLVARRTVALEATCQMLDDPSRHEVLPCDIANLDAIEPLMKSAVQKGKLYGLVHAAGICPAAPIAYQDRAETQTAMNVNYFAFLEMMRFVSKKSFFEKGAVVAVSSVSASVGWPAGAVYSGTKGALSASVRSLALEFAPKGVRVNAVAPSNIQSPMYDALAGDLNSEEGKIKLLKKQPLGLGQPEDVANAVCFLLGDGASFITGTSLVVDGGYLAQ